MHAVAGHDGIHITGCDNVTIEDCVFETGDDCIAGIDNINVTARRCELNTACSGLRFGGTNALFEKCHFYGPAKYLFRGSLTPEEKRSGKPAGGSHRYNMLSLMTYYADFMRDIRMEPGQHRHSGLYRRERRAASCTTTSPATNHGSAIVRFPALCLTAFAPPVFACR